MSDAIDFSATQSRYEKLRQVVQYLADQQGDADAAPTNVDQFTVLEEKFWESTASLASVLGEANTLTTTLGSPATTLQVWGDSTTDVSNSWADRAATEFNLTLDDQSTAGDQVVKMCYEALALPVVDGQQTAIQGGLNDGVQIEDHPNYEPFFQGCTRRLMLHQLVPDSQKLFANNARVALVGTWTNDTKFLAGAVNKVTNTNGDTATFTVYGPVVYIATRLKNAATGGTFTVSIDGVSMGTVNAYTSSGAEGDLSSGTYNQTPTVLRYAGLSVEMHTVVVTVTSATNAANTVWLDWVAGALSTGGLPGNVLFWCDCTRKTPTAYTNTGGTDAITRAINEFYRQEIALLAGDGFRIYYVPFSAHFDPNFGVTHSTDGTHPVEDGKAAQYTAFRSVYAALRTGAFQNPLSLLSQVSFGAKSAQTGTQRFPYGSSTYARNSGNTEDVEVWSSVSGGVTRFGGGFIVDPTNGILFLGDVYAGVASPLANWLFSPIPATGANVAGANLVLRSGLGTGNADPGYVQITTGVTGSSGSTVHTARTVARFLHNGAVDVYGSNQVPARVGGTLESLAAAYSLSAAATETAWTDTIDAGAIGDPGEMLRIEFDGFFANTLNDKRVEVLLGATTLYDSGAVLAPQNTPFSVVIRLYRQSGTAWRSVASVVCETLAAVVKSQRVAGTENLGTNLTLLVRITGGAAGDVIIDGGHAMRIASR